MDVFVYVCMYMYMQIHCKSKSLEVLQPENNMTNKPKETGTKLTFERVKKVLCTNHAWQKTQKVALQLGTLPSFCQVAVRLEIHIRRLSSVSVVIKIFRYQPNNTQNGLAVIACHVRVSQFQGVVSPSDCHDEKKAHL